MDDAARDQAARLIEWALAEDLGSAEPAEQMDITTGSVVPDNVKGSARFVSRETGIVCGLEICQMVVDRVRRDLQLECILEDGAAVIPGETLAVLAGNAQDILVAERTCLNFMCRLSGISTLTRRFVEQVQDTGAQVLDTRKTSPGWRYLEKYAVRCGGGFNHRMGLFDAVLIKDNHLAMLDIITDQPMHEVADAIAAAREWIAQNPDRLPQGPDTIVQIEVDRLDQLEKALAAHPDIVLLDNMDLEQLRRAVAMRNETSPHVLLEASGGVNLGTIANIAKTGVDRISVGALTHSATNFDIGLDWQLGD